MSDKHTPVAIIAAEVPARSKPSVYPDDDLKALLVDGQWEFTSKNGTHYE